MENIQNLIKEKGLKNTFVAEKIGKSVHQLSQWLNNKRKMPDEVKRDIYKVLLNSDNLLREARNLLSLYPLIDKSNKHFDLIKRIGEELDL